MRYWQIILASVAAACVSVGVFFLPNEASAPAGIEAALRPHWLAAMIAALGVYGIAALVLSTATMLYDLQGTGFRRDWARRYLARLAVAQYFTVVLALFALSLSPLPEESLFSLPPLIARFPAITTAGVVVLAGILGSLAVAISAAYLSPPLPAKLPTRPEHRLLQEIIELLNARQPEPNWGPEIARLYEGIERNQRAMLDGFHKLTTAVERMHNGVAEVKTALQSVGPDRPGDGRYEVLSDINDRASELQTAASALIASVARIDDVVGRLFSDERAVIATRDASIGSPVHELQQLLREMNFGAAHRDKAC